MPAKHTTTDHRDLAAWAGTHADLTRIDDILSECFRDKRDREQSEWEAAYPEPGELGPNASQIEKMTAENVRLVREITRTTSDTRFTDYCSLEFVNRSAEVTGNFADVSPSLDDGPVKSFYLMRRYQRDSVYLQASVHLGRNGVGVHVEGTDPLWVESVANLLVKELRAGRPGWAFLVSPWGYVLSLILLSALVVAIVFRIAAGLDRDLDWWVAGLVVWYAFSVVWAIGNPWFHKLLLPRVDVHAPGSEPRGSKHSKWIASTVAAAILGVVFDILLRG